MDKRNILLSSDIDCESVETVINDIIEINSSDDSKEDQWFESMNPTICYDEITYHREPIKLYINSHGGYTYSGLALVDIIKNSKTPIYTIAIGACMSSAFWIWLAGHKRFVGKNSTLLFHDISMGGHTRKAEDIMQDVKECERLREILIGEILEKSTKVTREMLNQIIENRADWYIPADKAIELGLANQYYTGKDW